MKLIEEIKNRGILIVDDEKGIVEIIKKVLNEEGFNNIYTAFNGVDALSQLSSCGENIYLVLLDLMMPKLSGMDVVKHLSNVHQFPIGIIIITGFGSISVVNEFYQSSKGNVIPLDFIPKPFKFDDLLTEVYRTLDAIHKKRQGYLDISAKLLHDKLDEIGHKISPISVVPSIKNDLERLLFKQRGFFAELGLDVVRIVIIALMVIGLLYFGIGDLLKRIIN